MKTERNSSIELLRLVAMLMIVARHYITLNPFIEQFSTQPLTFTTMFYEWIVSLGKIGVAVFFIISAWYLCEETHPTIRKGLKRAWILEREVLFYSLGLMLVFVVFQPDLISKKTIALSFIPTISGSYWWYVTAYALFLVLSPYLTVGLRAIGKQAHAALCALLLIIWGLISGMLPANMFQLIGTNFIDFLYLYILITFYRWYLNNWGRKIAWILVTAGTALIIGSFIALQYLGYYLHVDALRQNAHYLSNTCVMLPVILVGFGIVLLAESKFYVNRIINYLAGTTFGIYLIQCYPPMRDLLWIHWFNSGRDYTLPHPILRAIISILLIFFGCMATDCIRKTIFSLTADRRPGAWFYICATFIESRKVVQRLRSILLTAPNETSESVSAAMTKNQTKPV